MTRELKLGLAGLVMLRPATVLVVTGVAGIARPEAAVHPVLVIGGLASALALNLVAAFRLRFGIEDIGPYSILSLRMKGTAINLITLSIGILLLAAVTVYVFVENFQPRLIG